MDPKTPRIAAVMQLIETLRGENGCPWDKQQTPGSLAIYLIEEVFELVDAIESGDDGAVCEELGDVLFQVLFVAHLYREQGAFDIEDAAGMITEKMVRRHPHVFGNETARNTGEIRMRWHEIKKQEKRENGHERTRSVLDSVPAKLPALMRAYRISERAARTGFDWEDIGGVIRKAEEEWGEFNSELAGASGDREHHERSVLELGDVLFTLINVARFAGIHPETALNRSTRKFEKRFRSMERSVSEGGRELESLSRDELDRLWETAKKETDG